MDFASLKKSNLNLDFSGQLSGVWSTLLLQKRHVLCVFWHMVAPNIPSCPPQADTGILMSSAPVTQASEFESAPSLKSYQHVFWLDVKLPKEVADLTQQESRPQQSCRIWICIICFLPPLPLLSMSFLMGFIGIIRVVHWSVSHATLNFIGKH